MNQEKIGKFIADERKKKKLTQLELAQKIGVTDRAVSKWETGKGMPDYSTFPSLCTSLDITLNELLAGERNMNDDKIIEEYIIVIDKEHKYNIYIIVLVSILLFLCLILSIYFLNSYNKIKVYKIEGYGEKINLRDANLVLSNQYTVLDCGNLEYDNNSIIIINAVFTNKVNGEHFRIAGYEIGKTIYEEFATEVEFAKANFDYMPDNMYLIVYYMENGNYNYEEIKIKSKLLVTSDKLYYLQKDGIAKEYTDDIKDVTKVDLEQYSFVKEYKARLVKNGFKLTSANECGSFDYCAILDSKDETIIIDYINTFLIYHNKDKKMTNISYRYNDEYTNTSVVLYLDEGFGERIVWDPFKKVIIYNNDEIKNKYDKEILRYVEILDKYNPFLEE